MTMRGGGVLILLFVFMFLLPLLLLLLPFILLLLFFLRLLIFFPWFLLPRRFFLTNRSSRRSRVSNVGGVYFVDSMESQPTNQSAPFGLAPSQRPCCFVCCCCSTTTGAAAAAAAQTLCVCWGWGVEGSVAVHLN